MATSTIERRPLREHRRAQAPEPRRGRRRRPAYSRRRRTTRGAPSLQFRPEVEGLRAVAVLLVFANHLFDQPVGGFTGVDVFFVISGFLITGLLDREYGRTRRISIKGFYARRARRILPGALLVLVTSGVAAHFLFYASRAHDTLNDIGWAGGFLANVHFAAIGTDYFHANRPTSPVQHYWSLSVEEQFYVVWPLLLLVLSFIAATVFRRFAHHVLVIVVGALTIALFALGLQQTHQDPATAYFATTARAWELGVGALLAIALARRPSISTVLRVPAFLGGLVLIAYSAVRITESGRFPAPTAMYAVAGAALVIIGGTGPDLGVVAWPLTNPVSRYIGRVSYSLYLWHWPVITFLPTMMPTHDGYFDVTAICAAFAITVVSYHFIEDPLRRLDYGATWRAVRGAIGRRRPMRPRRGADAIRPRGLIALGGISLLVVALVAAALQPLPTIHTFAPVLAQTTTTTKATARPYEVVPPASISTGVARALDAYTFPKLDPSVSALADAHGPEWKICGDVSKTTLAKCTFPAQGAGPTKTLVVLGDSFGIAWTPAIRAAQAKGYNVVELTHSQCPAIDANFTEQVGKSSQFTAECNAARNWYVTEIAHLKPEIVVIGNYDAMLNNLASHAKGQDAIDEWGAGAKKIIARVKAAGAKRIVWLSSPPPAVDLTKCDLNSSATPSQCVRRIGDTWKQVNTVETAAAKSAGITMLDTNLFFCAASGYCPAFVGTTPTHTDGHHLTGRYATEIGPDLIPYVLGTEKTKT